MSRSIRETLRTAILNVSNEKPYDFSQEIKQELDTRSIDFLKQRKTDVSKLLFKNAIEDFEIKSEKEL